MQKRFTSTNAVHVDKIVFRNGDTLEDKDIMFFDSFIIVAGIDNAPDFFNTVTIRALYGVQEAQNKLNNSIYSSSRNIWF